MCLQLLCGRETYTINSLQHFVFAVTFPVCTRVTDQLEVSAKFYIVYVRSTAQIRKIALIIYGNISIFQIGDQIQFILIILEHFHSLCLRNFTSHDFLSGFCNLFHLFFDLFDILITDYIFPKIYIIVKSLCNNRSNPEFCLWVQMLDCLCHQMCTGMIQCF